eukprot:7037436-Pyramimonas_sp.AAC.1
MPASAPLRVIGLLGGNSLEGVRLIPSPIQSSQTLWGGVVTHRRYDTRFLHMYIPENPHGVVADGRTYRTNVVQPFGYGPSSLGLEP